ncbi:DNA-binding LytR/AlgR family response regulator [Pedobacter cryoconitis]|uniref:DNA-binding LytR/AlgR family response regulator n=1 Tax=Pedobacter cryoconitis TaxID=188932 RepID=A0A7W8YYD1_9SPHI|nr:LytTR family DNA-binding domain-containing protein [Pedobacter cryoconitis]MBB5624079.1 DNA-binding LytR/AlgR family response regulator [Pedobacter cryoconitis]
MYNCIIIEDELHTIELLKTYIDSIPNLNLVESYSNPVVALNNITTKVPIDLIIMDIEMPVISGLELSKELIGKTKKLIFITGHMQYAYEAFQVHADGFLLKPFTILKFTSLIKRLFPDEEPGNQEKSKNDHDFFFVKNKTEDLNTTKINFNEVIAIESLHNYIKIYTEKAEIVAYLKLSDMKALLEDNNNFIQVHRSFIISMRHIKTINGPNLKMEGDLFIKIGESYGEKFISFVKNRTLTVSKKK